MPVGDIVTVDGMKYRISQCEEIEMCTGCDLYKRRQGYPCKTEEMPCSYGTILKDSLTR